MGQLEVIYERVLVLKCQLGDGAALEGLYRLHTRRLRYYLQKMLQGAEAADDVQQEVWLTVVRKIRRLRHPEAFRVWLYRIARHRALDRMTDPHQLRAAPEETVAQRSDPLSERADEGFSPADAEAIHRALSELTAPHREVLILRFMEDLSYEEIAHVIGCGVGTVRSRIHYAKRALRPALEKHYGTT